MSKTSRRKKRDYEKTCECRAYKFPHRMFGGRCEGVSVVAMAFDENGYGSSGDCIDCNLLDGYNCQVLDGLEDTKHAACMQEFIRYEGVRPPASWTSKVQFFRASRS